MANTTQLIGRKLSVFTLNDQYTSSTIYAFVFAKFKSFKITKIKKEIDKNELSLTDS